MGATDSAGVPWAGRRFDPNPRADDDGSAPDDLLDAILKFRSGAAGQADVVDALRTARLLVPLVAELGEAGAGEHGHLVDKSQELSIVRVAGPDGRAVQPAFLSVAAMTAWNPAARPVPAAAPRVALAAAGEGTDLIVLDPTSATEFVVRRPAVWALAQGEAWLPSPADPAVHKAVSAPAAHEPAVRAVHLEPGDPDARLAGPELVVRLDLAPGLGRVEIDALLQRLQEAWSADDTIARTVDSMAIRLESTA